MDTNLNKNKAASTVIRTALVAVSLVGSMLVAGPAAAASACKGLENSACSSNASCGWVEGYQRKDGRTVKSFCRTKAVKKSLVKKSTTQKTEASSSGE